jgi:hypothetical protein
MLAEPFTPPDVAEMVVDPLATALVEPDEVTEAIAEFVEDQVNGAPTTTFPEASLSVATSATVCPTFKVLVDGVTTTTCCVPAAETVIGSVSLYVLAATMMRVEPAALAVSFPVLETEATVGFWLTQVIGKPSRLAHIANRLTFARFAVSPTASDKEALWTCDTSFVARRSGFD